jgi:hypothetical protein
VLPAVVDHAARAHFDTHTRQLAWTMADHLHRPEPPHDRLVTHPRLAAGRGDLRGRRRPVTASPPRVASTSAAAFDRAG